MEEQGVGAGGGTDTGMPQLPKGWVLGLVNLQHSEWLGREREKQRERERECLPSSLRACRRQLSPHCFCKLLEISDAGRPLCGRLLRGVRSTEVRWKRCELGRSPLGGSKSHDSW